MRFHEMLLGNQHEIWPKQHNGKVRIAWSYRNSHFAIGLTSRRHKGEVGEGGYLVWAANGVDMVGW